MSVHSLCCALLACLLGGLSIIDHECIYIILFTSLCTTSAKKDKGKRVHKKSVTDSPAQKGVNISRPTTAFEVRELQY